MQQGLSASAGLEIPALLAEDYWFEEPDLQIRETDGERVVSHVSLVWKQSEKSFEYSGYALNIFYVQANGVIKKRRITGYPLSDHNPFYGITDSTYRFTYGSGGSSTRVTHTKECKIGWFTDRELQVISASEDRIVLETSIRDFTRREPVLPEDFAGIRTVWIRITDPTNVGKWGRRPDKRHSQLGLGLGFGAETGALPTSSRLKQALDSTGPDDGPAAVHPGLFVLSIQAGPEDRFPFHPIRPPSGLPLEFKDSIDCYSV